MIAGRFIFEPSLISEGWLCDPRKSVHGTVALLTGARGSDSLPEGRQTIGIIQGDAVPQRFIPQLIELYRAGQFPYNRLVKFYDFREINRAIADAKGGDTIKPVLRISKV